MKRVSVLLIFYFAVCLNLKAQNLPNITFPPTANPPLLTIDSYTRASNSINLTPGFKWPPTSGAATNLLNLSIGSNPTYVNSGYLGSGINPQTSCTDLTDYSKPVGETPGNFAVSPSGAAIYNIPIFVSPGTKGVQPQLNIAYNSQVGTGLLGIGWSLGGVSEISRSTKTPMHDGKFSGVELSYNDIFAFEGNRLFSLNGLNGQNGTTYYTEIESFATITSFGSQSNGPAWFQVKDKNGNTMEFGNTSDSRLTGIGDNNVLSWYINKITDEFGNYMVYTYKQLNGEIVIDKIDYTGNSSAGLAPYNTVKFEYIDLAEKNSYYINGVEFRKTQLLKTITSYANNQLVRKYKMEYDWNSGTYLTSINEVGSDYKELNPTRFCWADPNDYGGIKNYQNSQLFTNSSDYVNLNAIPADLNGDGFTDYACVYAPGGRFRVMQNDFKTNYGSGNNDLMFTQIQDIPNQNLSTAILLSSNVTDNDYDNKQEVITVLSDAFGFTSLPLQSKSYTVKRTTMSTSAINVSTIGTFNTSAAFDLDFKPSQFFFDTKDYTGEGINDQLRIDPENINLTSNLGTFNFNISTSKTIARPFPFNNDGVADYIILENQTSTTVNVKIVSLINNGSGLALSQVFSTQYNFIGNTGINARNLLRHFGFGDFNGDGIGDLVYITETRNEMFVCTGTGTAFLSPQKVLAFTPLSNLSNLEIDLNVVDINGDGKTDIIITDNSIQAQNSPVNNYFSYFSLGNSIIKGASYSGDWTRTTVNVWVTQFDYKGVTYSGGWEVPVSVTSGYQLKADLNGDGIYDMTSFNSPSQDRTIVNNVSSKTTLSILSILTPMKKRIDIRYANINSEIYVQSGGIKQEIYKKQSTTSYVSPLFNFKPNIYCVNSTDEISGFNGQIVRSKKYIYSDAIVHSLGRGSLGFEQMLVFDKFNYIGTVSKSTINTTYCTPLTISNIDGKFSATVVNGITQYNINNAQLIAKSENVISLVPRYTKGYFISVDQITSKDYLKSTQAIDNMSYNVNTSGKISSSSTTFGWTGSPIVKITQNSYTYIMNNGSFKIQSETNTETQSGEPSYARTTNYNYDAQGHLTSIVNDPTFGSQMLTTTFSQFNSFGNAKNAALSAGDITSRSSDLVYDATGRFVIKKINALSDFVEFTYDDKTGSIMEEKDLTGLTTKYSYDGIGRLIKKILPNLAESKIEYSWDDPGASYSYSSLRFGVYSVKTSVEANGYSKVYCSTDDLVLRNETQDFTGQVVVTDTKYNLATNFSYPGGVVLEKTEPHYIGQQKYLIDRFDYETIFYRPSTKSTYSVNGASFNNTGIYEQIVYNPPSTDLVYNQGYVKRTDQNSQSITKYNNACDQVVRIENSYTGLLQTGVYAYASNGSPKSMNLTNSINTGQNILYSFVYNNLGQKIQAVDPSSGTTNYVYNSIGENIQTLSPSGIFDYTYDVLGRLITKTGSASGTTNYQYVTNGYGKENIDKIFGPNSTSEFKYDAYNNLIESKETIGTKILKSTYTRDQYGRAIQHTYPGGYITKTNYNSLGYLTSITDNNNQLIWQLTTQDALGRVREYSYGNGIVTKNTYDDLNYLTEIDHGNGTIHKQTYEYYQLTGNMKSRVFKDYSSNITLKEIFNFDALDRLQQAKQIDFVTSTQIQVNNVLIDPIGNITHKDDAGDFQYTNSSKPFTLSQVVNATNNISLNTLNITYSDFDKVLQIFEMGPNKQMDFVYGNDGDRIKMDYTIGGSYQYTRFYAENFDRQETASGFKEWSYIFAPTGLCAVYFNNNGSGQLLYSLNDNLGSPVLLTNGAQTILEEYSYDSWGRKRNPANWSYTNISQSLYMIRGFTLHEGLDEFALINMNGRVYDPVLGRFIQPDRYVQDIENLQNFNRYAYCLNNPLRYIDPTGYKFSDLKGSFEGFLNNLFHHSPGGQQMGNHAIDQASAEGAEVLFAAAKVSAKVQVVIWGVFFGEVAACGAAAIGVTGFIAGAVYGAVTGALIGAAQGAGNAYIDDQDMKQGAAKGAKTGAIIGGIVGGVAGGFEAYKDSRNFWTGEVKQYKLTDNLYASASDEPLGISTSKDKEFTVANRSDKDVYFKPEKGYARLGDKVKPGYGIKSDVDGIATERFASHQEVYKMANGGRAVVKPGGEVEYTPGFFGGDHGWKDVQYFKELGGYDWFPAWEGKHVNMESWESLFNLAKIFFK